MVKSGKMKKATRGLNSAAFLTQLHENASFSNDCVAPQETPRRVQLLTSGTPVWVL